MPITGVGAGAVAGGEEYFDRGDPASYDKTILNLTADNTWRDLDLSAIITDTDATVAHLHIIIVDNTVGTQFLVRENGNANIINCLTAYNLVANKECHGDGFVKLDSNRYVEYIISSGTDNVYLTVRGWLRPAS